MFKLGKNKYFVGAFAILMAVGLMAAYIPMLFPQVPVGETGAFSGGVSGSISSAANLNQDSLNGSNTQTATTTQATSETTSTKTLPASLTGLQGDLNSLNNLQKSINQTQGQ